ncbi:MAG TPA: F0F1 ATP synthase subunit A [Chloroflexota bacterium]|nr:F0F1 ATP synthase subunit A [Chloroflexota bacterium]
MPLQQLAQAFATEGAPGITPQASTGSGFEIPPLAPEVLFRIGPLGVTNTILYTYVVMVVLVFLAIVCTRKLKETPVARSWQTFAEVVIATILNVAEGSVGRERARRIFPLMATLFIFILTSNWFSLFPLIGPIYVLEHGARVSIFRAVNADWSTTLALALVTFVVTEFWGLRSRGKEHLMHFVKPIGIGQIELVSEFVRVLSLSVRLFGNLFAGEVLVTVMTSLIPIGVPAVFLLLETLFGFIQATVFTVLCLAYFTLNTTSHHMAHDEAQNPLHATAA